MATLIPSTTQTCLFGENEWKTYFGHPTPPCPLPRYLQKILNQEDPIEKTKKNL